MPPHYAISEAFITFAALYCGWKLFGRGQWMGALGVLCFGAAAAIGVYRFPSGQVAELAHIHKLAGLLGGLAGMALIASELIRRVSPPNKRLTLTFLSLGFAVTCVSVCAVMPRLSVPLFLFWSVAAIIVAACLPAASGVGRSLNILGMAIMLLNVIFIRQSKVMDPALSWHLFHTITAIWIIAVYIILSRQKAFNS